MSGEEFVLRVDSILKEKNIKRQTLADSIGFDSSTLAQWKNKNRLPDIETTYRIAAYLHVSPEWLITGKLAQEWTQEKNIEVSPSRIVWRIQDQIKSRTAEFNHIFDENFYSIIAEYVTYDEIVSWGNNRLEPTLYQLQLIAEKLTMSLQYLITGKDSRAPFIEPHIISLTEKYELFLKYFDCLEDRDQSTIIKITQALFHLERNKEK